MSRNRDMPDGMTEGQWADHYAKHHVTSTNPLDFKDWSKTGSFGICKVCKEKTYTVKHHISYEPEETVYVCRSCHVKIHINDKFCPDLTPDRVPEERRWSNKR